MENKTLCLSAAIGAVSDLCCLQEPVRRESAQTGESPEDADVLLKATSEFFRVIEAERKKLLGDSSLSALVDDNVCFNQFCYSNPMYKIYFTRNTVA